jgi:hypothetical protein
MAHTFEERAANIFDVLEKHNPHAAQPSWHVSESIAARAGAEHSDSDDEQDQQERIEVLFRLPHCAYVSAISAHMQSRAF